LSNNKPIQNYLKREYFDISQLQTLQNRFELYNNYIYIYIGLEKLTHN